MTDEERQAAINYSITKSFLARTHSKQYKTEAAADEKEIEKKEAEDNGNGDRVVLM
jgi:hypothetical protein